MKWNWLNRKKKCCETPTVLTGEVPDGLDMEPNTKKVVEPPTGKLYYCEPAIYVEPTDKKIIEGLEEGDNYEAAFLIKSLKKENMVLKGKLTKLTKKCNAYKEDLDNANIAVKELIKN